MLDISKTLNLGFVHRNAAFLVARLSKHLKQSVFDSILSAFPALCDYSLLAAPAHVRDSLANLRTLLESLNPSPANHPELMTRIWSLLEMRTGQIFHGKGLRSGEGDIELAHIFDILITPSSVPYLEAYLEECVAVTSTVLGRQPHAKLKIALVSTFAIFAAYFPQIYLHLNIFSPYFADPQMNEALIKLFHAAIQKFPCRMERMSLQYLPKDGYRELRSSDPLLDLHTDMSRLPSLDAQTEFVSRSIEQSLQALVLRALVSSDLQPTVSIEVALSHFCLFVWVWVWVRVCGCVGALLISICVCWFCRVQSGWPEK